MGEWYAYIFEWEAIEARQYFIDYGYSLSLISEIKKSDECDFQFKLNSVGAYLFGGIL